VKSAIMDLGYRFGDYVSCRAGAKTPPLTKAIPVFFIFIELSCLPETHIGKNRKESDMTIDTLATFFMWCSILNGAVLFFSGAIIICTDKDWIYNIHHQLFGISRDSFNALLDMFIAAYKLVYITFNLVPYGALLIMKHLY